MWSGANQGRKNQDLKGTRMYSYNYGQGDARNISKMKVNELTEEQTIARISPWQGDNSDDNTRYVMQESM